MVMKPLRMLVLVTLLHHMPGVCAAPEDEPPSDGRVRRHLLGTASDDVVADNMARDADTHERMVKALENGTNRRTDLLVWAAREAIEVAHRVQAAGGLRATPEEVRQAAISLRVTREVVPAGDEVAGR